MLGYYIVILLILKPDGERDKLEPTTFSGSEDTQIYSHNRHTHTNTKKKQTYIHIYYIVSLKNYREKRCYC